MEYDWPGNVRELENFVKRIVVLASEAPIRKEIAQNDGDAIAARPAAGQTTGLSQGAAADSRPLRPLSRDRRQPPPRRATIR